MKPVQDPELLALLESGPVQDPELLARLEEKPGMLKRALSKAQDFSEGIGYEGLKTYYGAKDLLGLGEESDRNALEAWRKAAGESNWGTAGQITGAAAEYMIPGGVLTKSLKAARAARPLLTELSTVAGIEATKLPGDGESRGGNAATGAGAALGGHILGKALGIVPFGMRGTEASERMRDMGTILTPGQLKEGLPRRLESLTEYIVPSASKSIARQQERSKATAIGAMVQKAAPPTRLSLFSSTPVPAKVGSVSELDAVWDEAWKAAWPSVKVITRNPKAFNSVGNELRIAGQELVEEADVKAYNRAMKTIRNILRKPDARLSEVDAKFRKMKRSEKDGTNKIWNEAIEKARDAFVKNVPKRNRMAIERLRSQYGEKVAIDEAFMSNRGLAGEMLEPADLLRGVRKSSSPVRARQGRGNLQQEARDWKEIVGPKLGFLPSGIRRGIQAFPEAPGVFEVPARLSAGTYPYQAALRKNPRVVALKKALRPSYIGGAALSRSNEDEEY